MFTLRLGARVAQLRQAQSPYVGELTDRFPDQLLAVLTPPGEVTDALPAGSRDSAALPSAWSETARVVSTTAGAACTLVRLADLADSTPDEVKAMADGAIASAIVQGRDLDHVEEDVELAAALNPSHLIVGPASDHQAGSADAPDLSEALASAAETALREGLTLLVENEKPESTADVRAMHSRITSVLTQGAPFGLLLNVEHASAAAGSDEQNRMDEIMPFLVDRVLSSHLEAVRIREGDEYGQRVVAYLQERGLDVPILVESRVIASATADATLLRREHAVAQPVACHQDGT
jgi:hypothetical protein